MGNMAGAIQQIAQQVAQDSIEILKETAKQVTEIPKDLAASAIESATSSGSNNPQDAQGKQREQGQGQKDPVTVRKQQMANKRLQEVKAELAEYLQKKRRDDQQKAQSVAQEEQQEKKEEMMEKKEKDNWLSRMMKGNAGESHGETMKKSG